MKRMPAQLRRTYTAEMAAAGRTGDDIRRWHHLERAHVISQPYPWPHTHNHLAMLLLALRQRDRREALGQILRIIVAAPGSALGRYPEGNTGRTRVGLMTPMPIPDDLAETISRSA
ncbi:MULTISPECIES: DUF3703 domain-containing protein [Rhodococcus erythropolis group]|uniref:DUF3703 domain-containing protein n=1 Tax=Rhodococcus erythropolis group TaxID=2840174 RepID=UPI00038E4A6C|nr:MULTISPECIES: DUF3703 domain-containing protein [Rhodococcus erythropolis group]EQM30130.1 hypothetical protein N601_29185 [Rhodococcus erythropolis DN1]QTS03640.1 DUF3703 domain-containing protein [Rhodococcus qingshengii]